MKIKKIKNAAPHDNGDSFVAGAIWLAKNLVKLPLNKIITELDTLYAEIKEKNL